MDSLLDNVIHLDRSASSIAPPVDQSSNGIVIAGVRTGSPVAHGHIHRNTITFASTSALVSGILLYGAENQELLENDINTSTTNQAYGLLAFSTFGTRVGDNTITGVGSPTNIGIYAGLSRSNIYCCNSISGAYVNSLFVGASNDTRIRQNDFGSANFGIRYASGTITGQQTHAGNRWNGTYANFGAQHLGNLLQAEFSQFFVGTLSPPLTPSTFSPSILFSPDINGSAASDCETDPVCSTFASLQNFITETDYSTANKEFLIGDYGDMLQFESERHLYEKLSDDEELTGKEGILDSFYVEQNHTPVAQLEEIQKELTSIMTLGASLLNQLEMDEPVITDYILDIEEVDSTFQQATTEIERNNLFSQKTSLLSSLSTLSSYRINELNGAREDIKITVGYAKQENEDLPTSNVLIVNEKTVTSSYIKNVLKGKELTTSDSIDLFNIASQCPQEGGRAVYKARGLYNSIFGSTIFDDELLCSGSSSSLVESRSDSSPMVRSSDKIVKLYPNPTSGNLTIEVVARHTNSTIKFQLLSITGKTVAEYNLMKNITEISLSELSSGLYFGKVITNGELFEVHKIIYSNE